MAINNNFINYKSFINNKIIILCASGESLNKFNPTQYKDVIYVTVNAGFFKLKELGIIADFSFCQDKHNSHTYINKIKPNKASFIGQCINGTPSWGFTDEDIKLFSGLAYYMCYDEYSDYQKDIINKPIWDKGCSVVFSAMQFLLWCEPKEIYLVGCDCTTNRFDNTKSMINPNQTIEYWKKIKNFANLNYPNIKIYSINPIGLKDIFPCKQ